MLMHASYLTAAVAILFPLATGASALSPAGPIQIAGNAWHLELADVTGNGERELLYASYDGAVCCQRPESTDLLWRFETGAFPYDLTCDDLDGDGRAETLLASSDGSLYGIGSDGSLRFRHQTLAPLYQVAVARVTERPWILTGGVDRNLYVLDADGKELRRVPGERVVRNLAAGDLDGDGSEEIVLVSHLCEVEAFKGPELTRLWRRLLRPVVAGKMQKRGHWRPYSIALDDLDGDGRCEILLGSGFYNQCGIRLLSHEGELIWDQPEGFDFRDGNTYSHTAMAACDVVPGGGKEILGLNACRLHVFDRQGKRLTVAAAPVSFTDLFVARSAPDDSELFLASSPNGDDQVYRVSLTPGWEQAWAALKRTGKMEQITDNLDEVRRRIIAHRGTASKRKYILNVTGGQPNTARKIQSHFGVIDFYRQRFPYENLTFAMTINVSAIEGVPGFFQPDRRTQGLRVSAADIPALLKTAEDGHVHFWAAVGHGCEPQITLETAEQILRTCPDYFLGFMCSENTVYNERLERYLQDYWFPLMDLCKRYNKKAILIEKAAWWATIPAMSKFRKLVDGSYADVLVMSVEDSNSRCPELNLASRAGLLLAGAVNTMSARTISDELCWNRYWEWEFPMTGHPFLRRQMVQALLGATVFEFHVSMHTLARDRQFTPIGRESVVLLAHMLGKGLLLPPKPNEMLGIVPLAIRMREPDEAFLEEAYNLHHHRDFEPNAEQREWPFEGLACHWGAAPVQPGYLGSYLFEQDRHYGTFVPATPFGFPVIMPAFLSLPQAPQVTGGWETDGRWFYRQDKRLSGTAARLQVLTRFREAANRLPFRVEGHAFMQAQRLAGDTVRLTLIDPGFLDPADREVTLHVQTNRPVRAFVDVLSGERLPVTDAAVRLLVPAGSFRILETAP